MARHAKDTLRSTGISQILNLPLTVPTSKAISTESLVSRQNCQILNLVTAMIAAICTIITDQGAIAEEE